MVRTLQRPLSVGLAFALMLALFAAAPKPAQAHDSCAIAQPAATGVLGAVLETVNVYASFVSTTAECDDKFAGVRPKLERDFETEASALQTTQSGAQAETYAECVDGMAAIFPCDGVDLLSYVSLAELGTARGNDIWGWTDPETGKEYALVGATTGTVFVDISDPRDPQVQGILPSTNPAANTWRDIKVFEDYAFVVADQANHGLQVFDLTDLRDWDGTYNSYELAAHYTGHGNAHNIFVNEDTGYAYSVGAGPFSVGGVLPNVVTVDAPSPAAGAYQATGANFGHAPTTDGMDGPFAVVVGGPTGNWPADTPPGQGCNPLVGFPAGAIAIADRGTCPFAEKAAHAQAAGAVALIVANSAPGAPITMGGDDPTVTIPSVMVSQADGVTIKAGLPATGSVAANPSAGPVCGNGLHMIDINDPLNPEFAGCFQDHGYVHDTQCVIYDGPAEAYQGRELCFNSNPAGGNNVAVVDVTDKEHPVALSRESYPQSGYSHQGWLTEDHRYFLHGDELDERDRGIPTTTRVWNVEDPANPALHQVFTYGTTSIDHNLYVEGRFTNASNYTTGLRLFDGKNIDTDGLTHVGFFDVYPENDGLAFVGTWSNYPYYEQPNVVAVNSVDRGLFIVSTASAMVTALENELDALLAAGGIPQHTADKVRHALETGDAWLKLPKKQGPALSHFDRAVHLLLWQADVVDKGKPQGDADGLRDLAASIQEFLADYR